MSYEAAAIAELNDSRETNGRSPLLQPDVILPEQYFAALRAQVSGERLLALAVLEDAVDCFQRFLFATRLRTRRLFRDAEQWIMEKESRAHTDDTHPHLSFEHVCDGLGLDPADVRQRLQQWRQHELASVRPSGSASSRGLAQSKRPRSGNPHE